MQLLTILAPTAVVDNDAWLTCGGLVDRQTSGADDVVLLSDPATVVRIAAAAGHDRHRMAASRVA